MLKAYVGVAMPMPSYVPDNAIEWFIQRLSINFIQIMFHAQKLNHGHGSG